MTIEKRIIPRDNGTFTEVAISKTPDGMGFTIEAFDAISQSDVRVDAFRHLVATDRCWPYKQPMDFWGVLAERKLEWLAPLVSELQALCPEPATGHSSP